MVVSGFKKTNSCVYLWRLLWRWKKRIRIINFCWFQSLFSEINLKANGYWNKGDANLWAGLQKMSSLHYILLLDLLFSRHFYPKWLAVLYRSLETFQYANIISSVRFWMINIVYMLHGCWSLIHKLNFIPGNFTFSHWWMELLPLNSHITIALACKQALFYNCVGYSGMLTTVTCGSSPRLT